MSVAKSLQRRRIDLLFIAIYPDEKTTKKTASV
jgi:hypothetical protein